MNPLRALDTLSMYILTAAGVLLSGYLPVFALLIRDPKAPDPDLPTAWRILAALAIAALISLKFDQVKGETPEKKAVAREGRSRNWLRRAEAAVGRGFMWQQLAVGLGAPLLSKVAEALARHVMFAMGGTP